ncbi:F0F1 ATP synthase subunit A [Mycoplasma parvum]|uniref:F0F1 ATP synthase subunit A n=1 Tax=Mycoplasma parvum str. Indiana TaxID=1403316 RepID=U5NC70_9MOLU|nr:F0F1 ATP synthase subunit A [Mycoplasma parvum]AGX89012.1 hypothetical protein PRV_01250 [Mycoplasma parvum str. Indiana]
MNFMELFFSSNNDNGYYQNEVKVPTIAFGVFLAMMFIFTLGAYYKDALYRTDSYDKLPKLLFIVFLLIRWIKNNTIKLLGSRNKFAIPFFIYIMLYFWACGIVNMLGFPGLLNFLLVPLTLSGLVFFGTLLFGVRGRSWGFFSDYCIWIKRKKKKIFPIPDVLAILGEFSKTASLAFRLWGNYFAGTLFLFMFSHVISPLKDILGLSGSIFTSFITIPLHLYFDVVDTVLHSTIFLFLTMTYWSLSSKSLHHHNDVETSYKANIN